MFSVWTNLVKCRKIKKANRVSHRSTVDPCFLPDLGEFTGAGRTDLPLQM
jgi:hypothetical protein